MQQSISSENQNEQNAQQQAKSTVQAKGEQSQQNGLVNTMFGPKPPIQTKAGRKGPIQAKQRPIQRNTKTTQNTVQRNQTDDLKTTMGNQYGVDLSGYTEHKDSSFPGTVGALATIQGKDIHYAPGQFTLQNRKHEFGHAIDNTLNGTPKGDMTIQGQNIDTTREAAADKIMNTPLQRKTKDSQNEMAQPTFSTGGAIQRITFRRLDELEDILRQKFPVGSNKVSQEVLRQAIRHYVAESGDLHDIGELDERTAYRIMKNLLEAKNQTREQRAEELDRELASIRDQRKVDANGKPLNGRDEELLPFPSPEQLAGLNPEERAELLREPLANVLEFAKVAKVEFDRLVRGVARGFRHVGEVKTAPVKGIERSLEKVVGKYKNNPDKVIDAVRGTIVFDTLQDLRRGYEHLIQELNVVQVKNEIGTGGTSKYRDTKLNIRLSRESGGMMAELQLQLSRLNQTKEREGGHEIYELARADKEIVYTDKEDKVAEDGTEIRGKTAQEQADEMKEGLDKVKETIATKALEDDGIRAKMDQYHQVLDEAKAYADTFRIPVMRKIPGYADLLDEISQIVYHDANEEINEKLEGDQGVQDFFTEMNQKIRATTAENAALRAAREKALGNYAMGIEEARARDKRIRFGDWVRPSSVVIGPRNEAFEVIDVPVRNNNCLIYSIATALRQRITYGEAAGLREHGLGDTTGDFLENTAENVNQIVRNFGMQVTIHWWTLGANNTIIPAGSAPYGQDLGRGRQIIHILNVGQRHFQVLRRV
ncbi:MAG TPA: hypothetical protein DCS93_16100 [Microscillaceae bacterium]|nr:hypothetical protein [Microscillaceae bacterium]